MLRRSGLARAVRDLGVRVRVQETSGGGESGGWLWSYLYGSVYGGGGFRSFVMDGQSVRCDEAEAWEQVGTDASNWRTTPEGGPFLELNGSDEYLRVSDNWTNQPGASNLLVATVFRPTSISGTATIIGKWDEASNDRSWILRREGATVQISTCKSGMSGDVVTLTSSYAVTTGAWIFVAGYWETATRLKLWIAKTTDEALTADENTTLISSELYAATGAYVTIGARSDELTEYLAGAVAPSVSRIGTPSEDIDEYVYALFDLVRDGYWRYPADVPSMYLLRATFAADDQAYADAQVLDTEAEGVQDGQLTVVELDGTLAIVGNECAFTAQGTPTWGDLGLYSQAVTRALGTTLFATIEVDSNAKYCALFWTDDEDATTPDDGYQVLFRGVTQTIEYRGREDGTDVATPAFITAANNTDYQLALVLGGYDSNGVPYHTGETATEYLYGCTLFAKGGVWTDWILLFRDASLNTATMYAAFANNDASGTLDDFRVPDADLSAVLQPVVKDTFTDSNGTGLDAHTPDVDAEGGGWTEYSGAWEINGNHARQTSAVAGYYTASVDCGEADVFVRAILRPGQANGLPAVVVRQTDDDNYYEVQIRAQEDQIRLVKMEGGGGTLVDSAAVTIDADTDYEVTVICDAETITGWVNGDAVVTSAAASFNKTATQHGFCDYGGRQSLFDDFHVHALRSDTYDDELDWL